MLHVHIIKTILEEVFHKDMFPLSVE